MNTFVIDASVAIKWVVEEEGTSDALALRRTPMKFIAPELFVPECANILWKKVQRWEMAEDEALLAARLLQAVEIELLPLRGLLEWATRVALELRHSAYDCLYLVLALANGCRFVTAEEQFVRQVSKSRRTDYRESVLSLRQAVQRL